MRPSSPIRREPDAGVVPPNLPSPDRSCTPRQQTRPAGAFWALAALHGTQNPAFRWLARSRKRHYTFARCEPNEFTTGSPRRHRCLKALICRKFLPMRKRNVVTCRHGGTGVFRSLRLSVRTPPFHGGESGSIPLGSASEFNG